MDRFFILNNSKAQKQDFLKILFLGLFCFVGLYEGGNVFANEVKGLEEVARLLKFHRPILSSQPPSDRFEKKVLLFSNSQPVLFSIPGFQSFNCGKCHKPEALIEKATQRIIRIIVRMKKVLPQVGEIPLRQYIIQTYSNPLLQAKQFAHATFDTIRLFPRTIIVDAEVYGHETQYHEILHLTQPFVGHPNELEAYGLNIRSDPRFMFLNFPYFENVFKGFFKADFGGMLNRFYGRDLRGFKGVPEQILQFSEPFESETLEAVAKSIEQMEPVLDKASTIIRQYPLESAYLSEQTGVRSLILDLAAVLTLKLPQLKTSQETTRKAFDLLNQQFDKTDNTNLGYVIDRKNEALTILKYQNKVKNDIERLSLYFHFLKKRFFSKEGILDLTPIDTEDFKNYVDRKLKNIEKMLEIDGITEIEIAGGKEIIDSIKKELQAKEESLGVQ